jgi:hypothetical protein
MAKNCGSSVGENKFVEVKDEAASVGESVIPGISGEIGELGCGGLTGERKFEGAFDSRFGSRSFTGKAVGETFGHADHEAIVEEGESLERGKTFVAFLDGDGGIGAVERGHERLLLGTNDEAVNGPTISARITVIVKVILVMWRVFRLFDYKILKSRTEHGGIEPPTDVERGVADIFGFQFAAVHTPKEPVVAVSRFSTVVLG